jgi:dynein light chain Tctex-type 1
MAEGQQEQDFLVEDVEAIIKASLQATLSSVAYDHEKVNLWTTQVVDSTLKGLQSLEKTFKYVVTVIIMQKTGAGLHTSAGAYWDTRRDGERETKP